MRTRIWATGAILAAVLGGPTWAEDIALVIGNREYRTLDRVSGADRVVDAAEALRDEDIAVVAGEDVALRDLRALVGQFEQMAPSADALLVVLAGRFVQGGNDTFFLPVDSDVPGLTTLPGQSLPLSSILQILSLAPGEAFLVLAEDGSTRAQGPFLTQGIGDLDIPQGVTVVRGTPRPVADLLRDVLAVPGATLREADDVLLSGFLPDQHGFLGSSGAGASESELRALRDEVAALRARASDAAVQLDRAQTQVRRLEDEQATLRAQLARLDAVFWSEAQALDTAAGYERYVSFFPNGAKSAEARRLIQQISGDPFRQARLAEEALALTRDERRLIQRNLTALGFDTRGVDGIFGNGTRTAIRNWQARAGLVQSGFLDRTQIRSLNDSIARAEADRRTAEEARLAEALRNDNAYWRQLGSGRDEAGLRSYLERYPEGQWAKTARDSLNAIDRQRRAEREARLEEERRREDEAYWRRLGEGGDEAGLRAYLDRFPQGRYADTAVKRLNSLVADREARAREEDERQRRRADDAFWQDTGANGTEAGLRAYLDRYPEGRWADTARTALASLSKPAPEESREQRERRAWENALGSMSARGYEGFLEEFPDGRFADDIRNRLREVKPDSRFLQQQDSGEDRAAAAAEQALGLNGQLRSALEDRLVKLGYDAGAVDGTFDDATRRALRQYQKATGLPVTGYVSQPLVVQLLTDSVLDLLKR